MISQQLLQQQQLQMSSMSLKEFSKLIVQYVNRNLVPLLSIKESEQERAIENWRSLSRSLNEVNNMDFWTIENLFKKVEPGSKREEQYRKYGTHVSLYSEIDRIKQQETPKTLKNHVLQRMTYYNQDNAQRAIRPLNGVNGIPVINCATNNFYTNNPDSQENQGMDKLINSFRKLVYTINLNHTKMLNQQNQKENYKDSFSIV